MRLTGERPIEGRTPDSLLALHDAGYREVRARVGEGVLLDIGCGLGTQTVTLAGPGRTLVGVDYDADTAVAAGRRGLPAVCSDGARIGLRTGAVDWACSSHIIEHFFSPATHVAELARVLSPEGSAFVLTPNAPADFENPYHLSLLRRDELEALLTRHFDDVWVGALEASEAVKQDFAARRRTGNRLLSLDVLNLRKRLPRRLYIKAYVIALGLVYRLLGDRYAGGSTGITADDFFVADAVDEATPVLFAVARKPKRSSLH